MALMYHGVVAHDGQPNTRYDVRARAFAHQLDLLIATGWKTTRIADWIPGQARGTKRVIITFDDGYRNNYEGAVRPLLDRRMTGTWYVVADFIGQLAPWVNGGRRERELLTRDELAEMIQAGFEIGSHGRRHRDLTQIVGDDLHDEIAGSKRELEDRLATAIRTFAYPYGRWNAPARHQVIAAGYEGACATRAGFVEAGDDRYTIRRVAVTWDDSLSTFARKLALAENAVGWRHVARYGIRHLKSRLGARQP